MTNHNTLIVVVDHSAEGYAAELVDRFHERNPSWQFFGVGGDRLAEAGVELLEHSRHISVVGIFEVLPSLFRLKMLQRQIVRECHRRCVKNAILIDYPDFNLRLAKKLSLMGIRVYYYISPTIWAWRPGRIEWIRRYVHHLFLIFPFEEKIYRQAGVHHISYVGHPLVAKIKAELPPEAFRSAHGLSSSQDLIALLPGSRLSEVKRHMPIMLAAVAMLNTAGLQPVILKADSIPLDLLQGLLGPDKNRIAVVPQQQGHNLIAASRAVLSTCGTATLEIALLGTPFVVVYRVNPISYLFGHSLMRIKLFSIVNILAGRELVPELIQKRMKPREIASALDELLSNNSKRTEQFAGFSTLNKLLDPNLNPADRIVTAILEDQKTSFHSA